jgi:hypothetical protein
MTPKRTSMNVLGVVAIATAAMIAGCEGGDATGSSQSSESACFVAMAADFAPFKTWQSNHFESATDIGGGTHVSGPRTEYYNRTPDKGAASFPVGTVIVKVLETNDPSAHHVFAMAKRGCDFNIEGAKDWEWFELDDSGKVLWRGVAPPSGDTYNGDPTGGCNSCHGSACTSNDSVCSSSPALQLSK